MKCTGLSESQRLALLLENGLQAEASKWKVPIFQGSNIKGTDISPAIYEQTVLWIEELRSLFHFYPETFGLAISSLNRMLATVKVQAKYLRCIAVACLYVAAKINEEDEVIPSVKTLAVQSGSMCSSAEILRMERIILDKLQWDLYMATPVDFLSIFHVMVMSSWPHLFHGMPQMNPSRHVALLTRQVQHCMACHQLLQFKGSTLALVIINLELERMTADWFPVISDLLKKAKVESTDFIRCKELVDRHLEMYTPTNPVYIFYSASKAIDAHHGTVLSYCSPVGHSSKPVTRVNLTINQHLPAALIPTDQTCEDLMETDEFYDGFQYLYKEDYILDCGRINEVVSGSKSQLEEGSCPCPILQSPQLE